MTESGFKEWLDIYGKGWTTESPDLFLSCMAEDVVYKHSPFHRPMKGRQDLRQYAERAFYYQQDVTFSYEILAVTREYGLAHWKAELNWKDTDLHYCFDGMFQIFLNDHNLCTELREWWHSSLPLPEVNTPDGGVLATELAKENL